MATIAIDAVNALDHDEFVSRFGAVFEDSPWVASEAYAARPFLDRDALAGSMIAGVEGAGEERQLALLRAHPDLAGRAAIAGELTDASTREQAGVGLDRLSPGQFERLTALNTEYRERFGFPFIVCVREHSSVDTIIEAAAERVGNDAETERTTALAEVFKIARLRLCDLVSSG